jgi:hypothetical protein
MQIQRNKSDNWSERQQLQARTKQVEATLNIDHSIKTVCKAN